MFCKILASLDIRHDIRHIRCKVKKIPILASSAHVFFTINITLNYTIATLYDIRF